MADAVVQILPDSTGKQIQAWANLLNGVTVYSQAVGLVDIAGIPLSSAKGVQPGSAIGVQPLKDTGRTPVVLNASGIATVAAVALVTMQKYVAGTVTAAVTDYTVTTGKTLRVQKVVVSLRPTTPSTTATFASTTIALRRAAATALTTTSPLVATVAGTVATNAASIFMEFDIPDGLEFASTDHIGFTQIGTTGGSFDISLFGFEY